MSTSEEGEIPAELQQRAESVVNSHLVSAYLRAVEHFNMTDLVAFMENPSGAHVDAHFVPREIFLKMPSIPEGLAKTLSETPREAEPEAVDANVAFWLVVSFPEGEMAKPILAKIFTGPVGQA